MLISVNANYALFISTGLEFSEIWIFSTGLEKSSNTKFYQNQSSGWRVVRGQTDGQTDMTKIIVDFYNFS